jgi:hypothetical protein
MQTHAGSVEIRSGLARLTLTQARGPGSCAKADSPNLENSGRPLILPAVEIILPPSSQAWHAGSLNVAGCPRIFD